MTLLIAPPDRGVECLEICTIQIQWQSITSTFIYLYIYIYVLLLKEQNNQIIKELKEIRKIIPNKQEIQQLSYLLENNKPKQIEAENKNLLNKVEKQVTNLEELLNTVKKIVAG